MLKGLNKIPACVLFICLFAASAGADLSGDIQDIISRKSQRSAVFTIKIIDAKSGQIIYSRDSSTPMLPASNMKLITSAAAVRYLGTDYQFTTRIGLLDDALVVIGGGDPLLGDREIDNKHGRENDWIFDDIAQALKEKGRTEINDIVIDSTFFDDNRVHPSWPVSQLNQKYACEVSGLNYNNNCLRITVRRTGSAIALSVDPQTDYVKLTNNVTAVSSGSSAVGAYRTAEMNKLIIKGRCNVAAGFDVAIERPAGLFGFMLYERLKAAGVSIEGKIVDKYVKQNRQLEIIREYKTSVTDVLTRCNKDSLGLAAESLLKTISAEKTQGRINGQWSHGRELAAAYLQSLGIAQAEYELDDGSGLSRNNRLSTNVICAVLADMYNSDIWPVFRDSLAVGGVDGTADNYFTDPKYKGKVFGKTGYISGVRAFSGVCSGQAGDYIFSILTEGGDSTTRTAINDIVKAVMDQ